MSGKKYILFFFCLLTLTSLSHTVNSEIYKWVDENGKVVYGDKPDSDNADKIIIKKAPGRDADSIEHAKKQKKLLSVMQQEREEKIAIKKEKKAKQQKQCAKIKKELQKTKDSTYLYEETDDPDNPRIFSDEERKLEEKKYERYIKENC